MDADVHGGNGMIRAGIQIDAGSRDGIQLIAHAEVGSAIEEGAGDVIVAARKDQGVGMRVIKAIDQSSQIGRRLGGQKSGF
jgi:hypothetical protein